MQKGLYFHIKEGAHAFLLKSDEAVSFEHRSNLRPNTISKLPAVSAWFVNGMERWPAVRLAHILGLEAGPWEQSVFIRSNDATFGISVEQVRLLQDSTTMSIRPFTAIGSLPGMECIYSGVWVNEGGSILVLNGQALVVLIRRAVDT